LRGESLLQDAIALDATRTTEEEIIAYIKRFFTPVIYPDDNGGRDFGEEFTSSDIGSAVKAFLTWSNVSLSTSYTNVVTSTKLKRASSSVALSTYGALIKSASISSITSIIAPKVSISYLNPSISLIEISRGTATKDFVESLTTTDNLVSAVGKHLRSTFGVSDQTFFISNMERSHSSNVSFLDNITTLFGHGRVVDDTVGITDTPSMAVTKEFVDKIRLDSFFQDSYGNIADKSNLATLSDTVSVLAVFKRNINENVTLLDIPTIDVVKNITRDPIQLSDSAEFIAAFQRIEDDSIVFGDSHTFATTKGLADTVSFISEFIPTMVNHRDFTDLPFATESVSVGVQYRRPILDTIRLDSFPSLAELNFVDKANLATLSDTVSRQVSYNRAPIDTLGLSEDIRLGRGTYHADDVTLADTMISSVGFNTFPEDVFEFTRSFTTLQFTKAAQDTFGFTDTKRFDIATSYTDVSFSAETVSIGVKYRRPILDKLRLDSFPEIAGDAYTDKSNLATVTDTISLLATFDRVETDSISLLSTPELGVGKLEQDLFDISDTVTLASGIDRSTLDDLGFLDNQFFGYGKNPTDTVTTASLLSFDVTKSLEDVADVEENIFIGTKYRRPLLDTIRLDSFPTLAEANYADKANLATLSDTVSIINSYNRSPEDTLSVESNVEKDIGTLQSDSLLLSDDPTLAFGYNRAHTDSFGLLDTTFSGIGKNPSDSINTTSQIAFGYGNVYVTDSAISETLASVTNYRRPILDTIRLDSFPTLAEANFADKSNLATLSDTVSIVAYYNRPLNSSVSLESVLSFDATTLRSDTFTFDDTVTRSIGFGRIFDGDEVAFDSSVTLAAGKHHTDAVNITSEPTFGVSSNVTDSLPTTEAISIGIKYRRPLLDRLRLDSFPTVAESNFADKSNLTKITDSVSLSAQYFRSATDTLSIATDSVTLDIAKGVTSETLGLSDTASLSVGFVREVSADTFSYNDSITFGSTFSLVEQNTVTDTLQKVLNSRLDDDVAIVAETVFSSVKYRRPILDNIRLDDSVIASDQNYRDKSNLATVTDSVTTAAGYYRDATAGDGSTDALALLSSSFFDVTKDVTSEAFSLSDSTSLSIGFNKSVVDGIQLIDAMGVGSVSSPTDTVGLSEITSFAVSKSFESNSNTQEQFIVRTKYRRPVLDTIRLDSFPTVAESNFADKSNLATLSDSITLSSGFARSSIDTVSVTSSLRFNAAKEIPTDTLDLTDNVTHFVTRRTPDLVDPISMTDAATFAVVSNPTENIGLLDEVTLELSGGTNQVSTVDSTENISKIIKYRRPLRDQLAFADEITLELTVEDSATRAINTSVINSETLN
jgi:hypothetical protein